MISHVRVTWVKLMYFVVQIDIYQLPSESRAAVIHADRHMTTGKLQVCYKRKAVLSLN